MHQRVMKPRFDRPERRQVRNVTRLLARPLNVRIGGVTVAERSAPKWLSAARKRRRNRTKVLGESILFCHAKYTYKSQTLWRGLFLGLSEPDLWSLSAQCRLFQQAEVFSEVRSHSLKVAKIVLGSAQIHRDSSPLASVVALYNLWRADESRPL